MTGILLFFIIGTALVLISRGFSSGNARSESDDSIIHQQMLHQQILNDQGIDQSIHNSDLYHSHQPFTDLSSSDYGTSSDSNGFNDSGFSNDSSFSSDSGGSFGGDAGGSF